MAKSDKKAQSAAPAQSPEEVLTKAIVKSKPYVIAVVAALIIIAIVAVVRERQVKAAGAVSAAAYGDLDAALKALEKLGDKRQNALSRRFRLQGQIEQMRFFARNEEDYSRYVERMVKDVKAIDVELAGITKDYDAELAAQPGKLQQVIQKYPNSGAAADAEFHLARVAYLTGKFEDAATEYKAFAAKYPNRIPLAGLALLGAADAYISLDRLDDAYAVLEQASKQVGGTTDSLRSRANYRAALCAGFQGKYEVANRHLNALTEAKTIDAVIKEGAAELQDQMKVTDPETFKRLVKGLPTPPLAKTDPSPVPAPKAGTPATP